MAALAAPPSSSNPPLVKKLGRDIWDLMTPLVSSGANKRSAAGLQQGRSSGGDQQAGLEKTRFFFTK
jgi:hypothetical protein